MGELALHGAARAIYRGKEEALSRGPRSSRCAGLLDREKPEEALSGKFWGSFSCMGLLDRGRGTGGSREADRLFLGELPLREAAR